MSTQTKIIAIDDDPTGSQTVHSCLLLTRWDVGTLIDALQDSSPLFFVLSNTRAMQAARAAEITRDICRNLAAALQQLETQGTKINPVIVSRSDSTLRGHYPVETDVITEELGPFDAHFLVPAFFEGGRITRDAVHYLVIDGKEVPVNETEFANDSVFAYQHAYLPKYVEEKTAGRIKEADVHHFTLDDVRGHAHGDPRSRLRALQNNACGVVDAEQQSDLDAFATQILEVAGEGKRFLFRSAASLLTSLAALPPQPVAAKDMSIYVRNGSAGVFLVGSHVALSSRQLEYLQQHTDVVPIHVDLDRMLDEPGELMKDIEQQLATAQSSNQTVVIYTSRGERNFATTAERLAFGERVSAFLMDIVRALPGGIGFLVSKGGITSNDVLSDGLALRTSRVVGQILPGVSVVCCPSDHPRFPDLPVVIFPGNVGSETSLAEVYKILTGK